MDNPGREMSEAGQSQEGSFAKDHLERREKEVAETVSFNASKNENFCFLSEAVEIWYAIRYEPLETNSPKEFSSKTNRLAKILVLSLMLTLRIPKGGTIWSGIETEENGGNKDVADVEVENR